MNGTHPRSLSTLNIESTDEIEHLSFISMNMIDGGLFVITREGQDDMLFKRLGLEAQHKYRTKIFINGNTDRG